MISDTRSSPDCKTLLWLVFEKWAIFRWSYFEFGFITLVLLYYTYLQFYIFFKNCTFKNICTLPYALERFKSCLFVRKTDKQIRFLHEIYINCFRLIFSQIVQIFYGVSSVFLNLLFYDMSFEFFCFNSGIIGLLKFRFCGNATNFFKKSTSWFGIYVLAKIQINGEISSHICGFLRNPEL